MILRSVRDYAPLEVYSYSLTKENPNMTNRDER